MDKIFSTIGLLAIDVLFIVLMVTYVDGSLSGVHAVADKSYGLEKVQRTTLVEASMEAGVTVKGGDAIGTIRLYQSTPGIAIEVNGWGTSRTYGADSGLLNREWYVTDFPGLGAEINFYEALFKVTRPSESKIVYTKI